MAEHFTWKWINRTGSITTIIGAACSGGAMQGVMQTISSILNRPILPWWGSLLVTTIFSMAAAVILLLREEKRKDHPADNPAPPAVFAP
jgi:hypothetical protein